MGYIFIEVMIKTLYTGGTFDVFHYGHMNFLRQCSKIADKVVVSLNTDEFIEYYKGKPPIMNYEERKKSLEFCKFVDEVIPNVGGADSKPSILQVKPHISRSHVKMIPICVIYFIFLYISLKVYTLNWIWISQTRPRCISIYST